MAAAGPSMQSLIWTSTIPLIVSHVSIPGPYILRVPRVSYLPLLLPRLANYFGPCSSFSYEGIPLKNLPVGVLCDLYRPELPWRITVGVGPLFDIHDTFMNSVKEADFIRYGTAKGIMSMSKENTTKLWDSVQDNNLAEHRQITSILLNPSTPLRNIPLRIYIPASPTSSSPQGSIKVVQALIPPRTPSQEVQTLGMALHSILPTLFPSKRDAILAEPLLHGACVPFRAPLEELMRDAAYADGWLHVCVWMLDG